MTNEVKRNPVVFISYSWAVAEEVRELADRLIRDGVSVIIDQYDLKEGQDKYVFMEQSVTNPTVDRVLIICDKTYAEKANARKGGVGDETIIISPDIYDNTDQQKFIPIIFEVNENGQPYQPSYIKTRIYIDLSMEGEGFEVSYERLLRNIYGKPIYQKPSLGTIPDWLETEGINLSTIRDYIKQIKGYKGDNAAKANFLYQKCTDEFVRIMDELRISKENLDDGLVDKINELKPLRDLYLEFLESLLFGGLSTHTIVIDFFEKVYNTVHFTSQENGRSKHDIECADFFIWESFICTTALLLHYERFFELNKILDHTYFVYRDEYNRQAEAKHYTVFRNHCEIIEKRCKPHCYQPSLFSLSSEILLKREKRPIITAISISTADSVLYQLGCAFGFDTEKWDYWFPGCYYHDNDVRNIWLRLKSKNYCQKIMPLFGVDAIENLKKKIALCTPDSKFHYGGDHWNRALNILDIIKIDDIASMS